MKTNKNKMSILFIILIFALGSCKKYEDGPGFSLRSKISRIVNDWQLEELKIEGTDYTADINKWDITFDKDLDFNQSFQAQGGDSFSTNGEWDFSNDKEELEIVYSDGEKLNLEIQRLTKKELWFNFTQTYSDDTSEMWECKFESE